jgi:hypothetical protein
MGTDSPKLELCVLPERGRASIALSFPILAIFVLIYQLLHRGYSVPDYFWLIADGQLNWTRQGAMWAALIFWIARYWPAAWQAIRSDLLIVQTEREVRLASGVALNIDQIISIKRKNSLLFKGVLFEGEGGELARQSLMFGGDSGQSAIRQLDDYLKQQKV